jgi:hypothetical protein
MDGVRLDNQNIIINLTGIVTSKGFESEFHFVIDKRSK